MAASSFIKFHYQGKEYTKEVPATTTQEERQKAVKAAIDEIRSSNATAMTDIDEPKVAGDNTVVSEGDPGISQRFTADKDLSGVQKTEDFRGKNDKPRTDEEQEASLETLADTLNELAYRYPEDGFVTKAVEPSGVGSYLEQVADLAYQASGHGSQFTQIANIFRNVDRFEKSLALRNTEVAGFTFITRPRLNLSDSNLINDRKFYSMRGAATDTAYAVRCLLDTRFHSNTPEDCPLLDKRNPFNVLLSNGLTAITGFNDPFLATETTDGGFFQEDQTYAIGGDRMAKTYDLVLTFRDFPGGPISYLFDMWYQYMMDIQDGTMIQYSDAIDANRMDYTVSIYRFILNRTRKVITRWAKATGCFPVNAPTGVPFNKNQGETYVTSNENFGITFKANRIEYNDPIIMHEFNTLVRRYCPSITQGGSINMFDYDPQNNFCGIPYIRANQLGHELVFVHTDDDGIELVEDNKQFSTTYDGQPL